MRMLTLAVLLALALPAARAAEPVAFPSWMQGCWHWVNADAGSVEQWSAPAGRMMLGMSKTIKGGKLSAFEFMRISEVEPGKLGFIAQPSGAAPTTFLLLRSREQELTFENLGHDFPQRIMYRGGGDKLLHARIEGTLNGKPKSIDFPMRRVPCEAAQ
jgi:hypothetical protein